MSTVATSEFAVGEHKPQRRKRPLRLRIHTVLRWLHIYTSMVSLVVVLFFAATGVTLNHPSWLATERTDEISGTLPSTWKSARGVDWLAVAECFRNTHGVHGAVSDRRDDPSESSISFKAPGYGADAFINTQTGAYKLTVAYQGAVGVLNDLHRGRDAGLSWGWLIDVAGIFLAFLSLTGFGLLFYLKKVRVKGLITLLAGGAVVVVLAKLIA